MDRLSIPSSQADQQGLLKAVLENTKATQQGVDKLGVNLLASIHSITSQAVTAVVAAPVKLTDFQSSVVTSGGVIHYSATINAATAWYLLKCQNSRHRAKKNSLQ